MIVNAIGWPPSAMVGVMPGYGACRTRPGFCGISATPTRLLSGAKKRSRWHKGCPFPLAWLEPSFGFAWFITCGEARAAQETGEGLIALSAERGLTEFSAYATMLRGWAMAEQGRNEEGIAQIQEGLAAVRATGTELVLPFDLCLLAEACRETGRLEDGLSALAEALSIADRTGVFEAEMYRLKGELLLRQDHSTVAEAQICFERAVEIARNQSAKSPELRATMSLARLLEKQGKRDEARTMLVEIYGWFTEGFDTADLREAKALLDELSR